MNISIARDRGGAGSGSQMFQIQLQSKDVTYFECPVINQAVTVNNTINLKNCLLRVNDLLTVTVSGTTTGTGHWEVTILGYKEKEKIII